jgi:hypothetical protein
VSLISRIRLVVGKAVDRGLSSARQSPARDKARSVQRHTSSSRLGRIFFRLSRSENVGSTLTRPFRKVAFSSLGFEAKAVGSRKFRVLIASEEKN